MRILFTGGGTGGHLYPALAIARAVVALDPSVRPHFIGARRGIERTVLPTTEFSHELLDLHPLYRAAPWNNWRTAAGLISALRAIGTGVRQERPAAVVGTGGYAAGAVLGYAALHGIPYGIQEQNSFPGLTVKLFARRAREVWLGFPEAAGALTLGPRSTAVDTGNPIEPPPVARAPRADALARWGFAPDDGLVLLVFGGSQGARALNDAVAAWVRRGLPPGIRLIWGTGTASYDQYAPLESDRVRVRAYLAPIADAYAAADLALTRAGAMTTAELCAWGIPMALVPLPTAAADHQTANAVALERAGAALHLPQRTLSVDLLDEQIGALAAHPERRASLAAGATARARPDAARVIAGRVLAMARARV